MATSTGAWILPLYLATWTRGPCHFPSQPLFLSYLSLSIYSLRSSLSSSVQAGLLASPISLGPDPSTKYRSDTPFISFQPRVLLFRDEFSSFLPPNWISDYIQNTSRPGVFLICFSSSPPNSISFSSKLFPISPSLFPSKLRRFSLAGFAFKGVCPVLYFHGPSAPRSITKLGKVLFEMPEIYL